MNSPNPTEKEKVKRLPCPRCDQRLRLETLYCDHCGLIFPHDTQLGRRFKMTLIVLGIAAVTGLVIFLILTAVNGAPQ